MDDRHRILRVILSTISWIIICILSALIMNRFSLLPTRLNVYIGQNGLGDNIYHQNIIWRVPIIATCWFVVCEFVQHLLNKRRDNLHLTELGNNLIAFGAVAAVGAVELLIILAVCVCGLSILFQSGLPVTFVLCCCVTALIAIAIFLILMLIAIITQKENVRKF